MFCLMENKYAIAQVGPLLTTTWNQTCYYNANCPTVPSGGACGRAYTGCNATAIAQICKYYNYPTSGLSNHCNAYNPTHCVDFSTQTYNYAAMPNNVTSPNAEVAKLIYHIGIAVDMQWSGTNSVSLFSPTPMKRYFAFSPKMYSTATYMFSTTQDLIDAVKQELDEGRVVYCKTNALNHFYIIDGYNTSDEFHCNFGWGGAYDGYYPINNVNIPPGNATPNNFIFNIRPLDGDLETALDTIVVSAAGGYQTIEFTSLQNWTMSTFSSWISLNQTSGGVGYYSPSDNISFNCPVNNGNVRYGYIFIDNTNDVDTIVVKQEASPLLVNPDTLYFTEIGGSQNITINCYSWMNWNVTSSDSWISVSQNTGTGADSIIVTTTNNPLTTNRVGFVIITSSGYTDTVVVYQDGIVTNINDIDNEKESLVFPNPFNEVLFIGSNFLNKGIEMILVDIYGRILFHESITQNYFDLRNIPNGIYILQFITSDEKLIQTKIIKQ